jgi:hypothetical protein
MQVNQFAETATLDLWHLTPTWTFGEESERDRTSVHFIREALMLEPSPPTILFTDVEKIKCCICLSVLKPKMPAC